MRGRPPKTFVLAAHGIWVDADHCTAGTLQVLYRMADLHRRTITVVSGKPLAWPESAYIRGITLGDGYGAVVARIDSMQSAGDYVITDNAGLAEAGRRKGVTVLNSQGANPADDGKDEPATMDNFLARQAALSGRGLMSVLQRKEQQLFALRFDHLLTRAKRLTDAAAALAVRTAAQARDNASEESFD